MDEKNKLKQIVAQFIGESANVEIEPLGKGHINDSYKVVSGDKEYVLQRINHHIFKNVHELQNNIDRVTGHIREKLENEGVSDVSPPRITMPELLGCRSPGRGLTPAEQLGSPPQCSPSSCSAPLEYQHPLSSTVRHSRMLPAWQYERILL